MKRNGLLIWSVLLAANASPAALADVAGFSVEAETRPAAWHVRFGSQPVLTYEFGPGKFKPYVKDLRTVSGFNVLRDAPSDHLHHHALMFGIRVNGVNFWEETAGNGVQKPVQSPPPEFVSTGDGQTTRIQQELHWLRPDDVFLPDTTPAALLIERRTIMIGLDAKESEVALEWRGDFEVGRKTNVVTLSGANYHGLGVRFLRELDAVATHWLGERQIELANNRQDISPSPWAAVRFKTADRNLTLVIAGHPANERGAPVFFSMKTPFAYLSATQGLDREPLVYRAGDRFSLRYLVLLYSEERAAAQVDNRVHRWVAGPQSRARP